METIIISLKVTAPRITVWKPSERPTMCCCSCAQRGTSKLKSDSTITSADLYAIYTMWCNDNTYKPLAVRTVSMTLKKHADEFGIEHDNHITNRLGKRVNGFWGIEALVTPPIL